MATNYLSTVAALADEVAVLLQVSNLDRRIYNWLAMGIKDIERFMPNPLFFETAEISVTGGSETATLTDTAFAFGTPVMGVYVGNTNLVYTPSYVTPEDYQRIARDTQGVALLTNSFPTHWTLMEDTGAEGRTNLYTYPVPTGNFVATLIFTGTGPSSPPSGASYFDIPYCFEHVIVWAAAAQGAKVVQPQFYKVYGMVYQKVMTDMAHIIGYKPDTTPVRKSMMYPYDDTLKMRQIPRIPDQV